MFLLVTNNCVFKSPKSFKDPPPVVVSVYVKKLPYKGHFKVGKPYKIKNIKYTPAINLNYDRIGIASWYGEGDGFHGRMTANGDIFDKNALTAAHPTLPLPSLIKVTHLGNHRSLVVMVNDRGPFIKGRILDLSAKAAEVLGMKKEGCAKVRIQYLPNETKKLLASLSLKPKRLSPNQTQKFAKTTVAKKKKIPSLAYSVTKLPTQNKYQKGFRESKASFNVPSSK